MEAIAQTEAEPESVSGFFARVQPQPFGAFVRHQREEAIDVFLTALTEGDSPNIACHKAGVFIEQLELWASEQSDVGKIFALQWSHAERYAVANKAAHAEDKMINGWDEVAINASGVVTTWCPIEQKMKPVMIRKYNADLMKTWLKANMPSKYADKPASAANAANAARDITDFTQEVPTIAPDEPGPAQPLL